MDKRGEISKIFTSSLFPLVLSVKKIRKIGGMRMKYSLQFSFPLISYFQTRKIGVC